MFFDRVAPSVFAAVLLFACGDSNLGTGAGLSLGGDGGDTATFDTGDGGTNSFLASGQCPPLGTTVCPNDNAATQTDVDTCNNQLSDPSCGSAFKTYLECAGRNVKCDSTGQSDSTAIQAACANEAQTYETCATVNATDGG